MSLNDKSKDRLLALVNEENAAEMIYGPLTFDDVDFANPVADASQGEEVNSTVLITAKPESRFGGEVTAAYQRLDLQKLFTDAGLPELELRSVGLTNSSELVTEINETFGLGLDEDDVVFEALPTGEYPLDYTLKTKATSFAWIGELKIILTDGKPPLSSVIVKTVLNGLKYPAGIVSGLIKPKVQQDVSVNEAFQTESGTLFTGTGNPSDHLVVNSNGELEVAVGARIWKDINTFSPIDGALPKYNVVVPAAGDWNIPFSIGLLDKTHGAAVLDLYAVEVFIQTADRTAGLHLVAVKNQDGSLSLKDEAAGVDITDAYFSATGDLIQEIQRASFYTDAFPGVATTETGALLGDFYIAVQARRLDSIAPRVLAAAEVHVIEAVEI